MEKELLQMELEEVKEQVNDPSEQLQALDLNHTTATAKSHSTVDSAFLTSGNNVYPKRLECTLSKLHGPSNISTCTLSPDETIIATGGADGMLALVLWNSGSPQPAEQALRVLCDAPVIAVAFSQSLRNVVAAGCMDGSVHLIVYDHEYMAGGGNSILQSKSVTLAPNKHVKYVRMLAWHKDVLATGSADGTIHIYRVQKTVDETLTIQFVKSLHLPGSVEAMVFCNHNHLVVYARGTPCLTYFDTTDDLYTVTQVNLNKAAASATGGFDDHVSFCILDLKVSHNEKYLAAATDASRNIILDARTGRIIRDLYGHQNDGYSQPKVAWSANDQYLLGNTQEDGNVVVWDISSSQIVDRLKAHGQPVRDLCCSDGDCLVTTSFDKTTNIWKVHGDDEH
jgi:WD40 repeat protein